MVGIAGLTRDLGKNAGSNSQGPLQVWWIRLPGNLYAHLRLRSIGLEYLVWHSRICGILHKLGETCHFLFLLALKLFTHKIISRLQISKTSKWKRFVWNGDATHHLLLLLLKSHQFHSLNQQRKKEREHQVVSNFCDPMNLPGACQVPPSMGFSKQEYWSGLPFPFPGDLPDPGMKPGLPQCRQKLYWLSYAG